MPVTNAINCSIRNFRFLHNAKSAAVRRLDKSEPVRTVERNYRPVSILNTFSKIFEKILKEQLSPFFSRTLSIFIAAYRTAYSTQHVLIKLVPHDLIIAKLHAYGCHENALVLVYSYLKRRKPVHGEVQIGKGCMRNWVGKVFIRGDGIDAYVIFSS